jgi:ribonuclease HI
MEDTIKATGLVLYCDGGARPTNPGPAGYGIHGYFYTLEEPKKGIGLGSIVATNFGYLDKSTLSDLEPEAGDGKDHQEAETQLVTVKAYVDIARPITTSGTNNMAELEGAISSISFAKAAYLEQPEFKRALILTDSQYVVLGYTKYYPVWKNNNWYTSSGKEVANKAIWLRLTALMAECKEIGLDLKFDWVRGHVETLASVGNTSADTLASIAANMASAASAVAIDGKEYVKISPPDKYWNTEVEKHPLLCHRRLYISPDQTLDPNIHLIGNHGADDALFGTRTGDGAYGVVLLDKEEPILTEVVDCFKKKEGASPWSVDYVKAFHLDTLFGKRFQRAWNICGILTVNNSNEAEKVVKDVNGEPIVTRFDPPMLSYRAMDSLANLYSVLQAIDEHEYKDHPGTIINDITDQIYEDVTDKKGRVSRQLKPEYVVGFMSRVFDVKYDMERLPKGDGTENVTLIFGVDIPDRSALKKLENEETKIYLVTVAPGGGMDGFKYYTIIHSKRGIGIFAGIYTNTKYLIDRSKKKKRA